MGSQKKGGKKNKIKGEAKQQGLFERKRLAHAARLFPRAALTSAGCYCCLRHQNEFFFSFFLMQHFMLFKHR